MALRTLEDDPWAGGWGGGGNWAGMGGSDTGGTVDTPGSAFNPYETFSSGAPTIEDIIAQLGIDPEDEKFKDIEKYLYEYDPTQEKFAREGALSNISGLYGKGASSLMELMKPTGSSTFASAGDTTATLKKENIYKALGVDTRGTILDFMEKGVGLRKDYRTELIDWIREQEERVAPEHGFARLDTKGSENWTEQQLADLGYPWTDEYGNVIETPDDYPDPATSSGGGS